MKKNFRARRWFITCNNPNEKGYTQETIEEILSDMLSLTYWCISSEIGKNNTPHLHFYLCSKNPIHYSRLKNLFKGMDIEEAKGSPQEARDYIFKEGKWIDTEKAETNVVNSHKESGELPTGQGHRSDLERLIEMAEDGKTTSEIIRENPKFGLKADKIERTRQIIQQEQERETIRELEIVYVWGKTQICNKTLIDKKTSDIIEEYGLGNVYIVTEYDRPFYNYNDEKVILFQNFKSSITIEKMISYISGLPIMLPSRYVDKTAYFTQIYIVSTIPLLEQYKQVQIEDEELWESFFMRIKKIKEYSETGVLEYPSVDEEAVIISNDKEIQLIQYLDYLDKQIESLHKSFIGSDETEGYFINLELDKLKNDWECTYWELQESKRVA